MYTTTSLSGTARARLAFRSTRALHSTRSALASSTETITPSSTTTSSTTTDAQDAAKAAAPEPFYTGPLAGTFHRLKLFSLSSLGLATLVSPFMLLIESPMPTSARLALAATAITTSGLSTTLVGWCGAPYVSAMWKLPDVPRDGAVEMATRTVFLREMRTRVVYPAFLKPSARPFAKWELAKEVVDVEVLDAEGKAGTEEIVAETRDVKGRVVGKWVVRWRKAGEEWSQGLVGECRAEGKIVRHFNVHEELLDPPEAR
ncbi:hypothetical protein BOTBODRAFT_170092 [Botryobasidium botryosum FD-172 SS1]|uniref:Uncharacterized protein n=1 Tax=Botryobasidium botryosum (strain FD-172 SS1) TaxID=930990 RepID=A0A067MZD8_BOTB1|nr:hypothetical protein BOTBODRAFT_170092 [Botryobasidium botryosum FD-172 SS1]